jgi:hypothetical protein
MLELYNTALLFTSSRICSRFLLYSFLLIFLFFLLTFHTVCFRYYFPHIPLLTPPSPDSHNPYLLSCSDASSCVQGLKRVRNFSAEVRAYKAPDSRRSHYKKSRFSSIHVHGDMYCWFSFLCRCVHFPLNIPLLFAIFRALEELEFIPISLLQSEFCFFLCGYTRILYVYYASL